MAGLTFHAVAPAAVETTFAFFLTNASFVSVVAVDVHGVEATAQACRKGRAGFAVCASGADRLLGRPGCTERPWAALLACHLAFFVLIFASIAGNTQSLARSGLARSFWARSRRGHGALWAVMALRTIHTVTLAFLGLEASWATSGALG